MQLKTFYQRYFIAFTHKDMDLKPEQSQDDRLSSPLKPDTDISARRDQICRSHKMSQFQVLAIIIFILYLSPHRLQIEAQQQVPPTVNLSAPVNHPTQLFLAPSNPLAQTISRVNGFNQKRSEEEEEGFIMQAAVSQNPQVELVNSTSFVAPEETTTIEPQSGEEEEQQQRIAIDANRQQFLTHDQISLLNASTKDETINLSPNGVDNVNSEPMLKGQTSRSGMSKVSHVSSFFSDLFAIATRPRPIGPIEEDRQHIQQTQYRVGSSSSSTSKPVLSSSPATCPGVCRNILTASILCRNEIIAPCPSILQKCCERDDVSFDSTPVETSAPLSQTDTDTTSNTLSESLQQPSNQEQQPIKLQTQTTTSDRNQTSLLGDKTIGSNTSNEFTTTTTTKQHQVEIANNQPESIYFLSSGSGSIEATSSTNLDRDRTELSGILNSLAQQPTNDNLQQQQLTRKQQASQSFDSNINENNTLIAINENQGGNNSELQRTNQIVLLQTANGTILHQVGQIDRSRRPNYANWTDYHLSMRHSKPATGQNVVYHSNIDPAKKFIENSTTTNKQGTNTIPNQSIDLNNQTIASKLPICTGFCMPKRHIRFCQSQSTPNTNYLCSNEDEFCCTQPGNEITSQTSLANNSVKDYSNPEEKDDQEAQSKVINDQHSSSKTRLITTSTTTSVDSTSPQQTSQQQETTQAPLIPTIMTTIKPSNEVQALGSVGNVLIDLLDSWISGSGQQTSGQAEDKRELANVDMGQSTSQVASFANPENELNQHNDRRLGLDLSFRQPSSQESLLNSSSKRQQSNGDTDLSGLMTSDGGSEQDVSSTSENNTGQKSKCSGYCTLQIFSMLCDSTYSSTDCGPNQNCCIIGRQASTSSSLNGEQQQLASNQQMATDSRFGGNRATCRGSCLPVYHSSLCTKPNELQMDSPGCLPNFVCCTQATTVQDGTNQIEDLEGLLGESSSSNQYGTLTPGHHSITSDSSQQQMLSTRDNSLLASLLPPPPPPLLAANSGSNGLSVANEQQFALEKGNINDQLMVASAAKQRPNLMAGLVQQDNSALRPGAKTTQSSSSGIMSQLYQMFKSNGLTSSKHQRQRQPVTSQPLGGGSSYAPIYEPYLPSSVQIQGQPVAANMRPAPNVQQQPMYQTMQVGQNILSGLNQHPAFVGNGMATESQQQVATIRERFNQQQLMQQASHINQLMQKYNPVPQNIQQQHNIVEHQHHSNMQPQIVNQGNNPLFSQYSFDKLGPIQQSLDQTYSQVQQLKGVNVHPSNFGPVKNYSKQQNGDPNHPGQYHVAQQQQQQQQQLHLQQQQSAVTFPSSNEISETQVRQNYHSSADNAYNTAIKSTATTSRFQQQQQYPRQQQFTGQQSGHNFGSGDASISQNQMIQNRPTVSQPGQRNQVNRVQQQHHEVRPTTTGSTSSSMRNGNEPENEEQRAVNKKNSQTSKASGIIETTRKVVGQPTGIAEMGDATSGSFVQSSTNQSVRSGATLSPNHQQQQQVNRPNGQQQRNSWMAQQQTNKSSDPNRRNNANRLPVKSNSSSEIGTKSSSSQMEVIGNPATLSQSSSNLNVMISNGPFVDLQRVADSEQQRPITLEQPQRTTNQQFAVTSNSNQPSTTTKVVAVVEKNLSDLSHPTGSTSEQSISCPTTCIPTFMSFNCKKPDYIDESFVCKTTGSLCCIKSVVTSEIVVPSTSSIRKDPLQLLTSVPGVTIASVNIVDTNKLDTSHLDSQGSSSDDETIEETSKTIELSTISVQNQFENSGTLMEDLNQQQVSSTKNRFQATSCGLPGPRRRSSGSARGRIMGGFESKPGHWCWQAALMNDKNEYLCGGALIGLKWVLTAAHCITQHLRSESPLYVRLGQHNLNSTQAGRGAKTIQVKTSYVHHNHNGITLDNDIALLRLEESVDLDEQQSICLVCLPERSSQMETGKRCTVTGYGFENETGPAALRIRQTDIPIVTDQECQNKTSAVLGKPFTLPASSFCAGGEQGQDACHGDGGSPLSCLVDGYYELTGIVSWGYKCGSKDLPGLYSKVSAFVGWINQIVSVNN